jgi:large subunit ribosomal protein L23
MSRHPYEILIRPLLTEKATLGAELKRPQYSFKVAVDANKIQIRRAVEAAYPEVKVLSVNTVRLKGKRKRLRQREQGRRATWKKAIVTLKEGQSIDVI